MKAIIGCAIEDKVGSWFVQLRTPSHDLFEQKLISTVAGEPSREEAVRKAMQHGDVTEIVGEWPVYASQGPRGVRHRPNTLTQKLQAIVYAFG